MKQVGENPFSLEYYGHILASAKAAGYAAMTVERFWALGCPSERALVLRHDVDTKPHTLKRMLDVERAHDCRSTLYVRIAGAQYNFLDYPTFSVLSKAFADGFRIGLHTNYLEFANINDCTYPISVLAAEAEMLRRFFPFIESLAPHRDHQYAFNSLPHIEQNWDLVEAQGFKFQAYDKKILDNVEYVNEGYELHLSWRNKTPEQVIPTGRSMCLMTHSHWWYENNPFEEWD